MTKSMFFPNRQAVRLMTRSPVLMVNDELNKHREFVYQKINHTLIGGAPKTEEKRNAIRTTRFKNKFKRRDKFTLSLSSFCSKFLSSSPTTSAVENEKQNFYFSRLRNALRSHRINCARLLPSKKLLSYRVLH